MTDAPTLSPENLRRLRKFEANGRWATAHDDELQRFQWSYVAIDDQRILQAADSGKELRKKYADREGLLVMFVSPPDMAWVL